MWAPALQYLSDCNFFAASYIWTWDNPNGCYIRYGDTVHSYINVSDAEAILEPGCYGIALSGHDANYQEIGTYATIIDDKGKSEILTCVRSNNATWRGCNAIFFVDTTCRLRYSHTASASNWAKVSNYWNTFRITPKGAWHL